jgi:hypothetical protein
VVDGSVAVGTATSYVPLDAVMSPVVRSLGFSVATVMSVDMWFLSAVGGADQLGQRLEVRVCLRDEVRAVKVRHKGNAPCVNKIAFRRQVPCLKGCLNAILASAH